MIGLLEGWDLYEFYGVMVSGREEGGRYSDDIQGWVSGLVGEDYDAFLLSCDLNNSFLIGSQL